MSAHLGPIHLWLFHKIQLQDQVTEQLLVFAEQNKSLPLKQGFAEKYGELEQDPLETIIDGSNIHGWLQQRVSLVERRLAGTITALLENGTQIVELEALFFEMGKANPIQGTTDAIEVYETLNDTFLDGMPCDRVNEVTAQDKSSVTWQRSTCVHSQYWPNGDCSLYYRLRDAQIRGMLDGTVFTYGQLGDEIRRIDRR